MDAAWPRAWTREIGAAVQLHRKRQGLSAEALSARCSDVGYPIPRNTIANLENGRKEGVPVHEVMVLAMALNVAPIDLLFPVALGWDVPMPQGPTPIVDVVNRFSANADVAGYQRHQDLLSHLQWQLTNLEDDPGGYASVTASQLALVRQSMQLRGMRLPDLPEDVAYWLADTPLGPRYEVEGQRIRQEQERALRERREALLDEKRNGHRRGEDNG